VLELVRAGMLTPAALVTRMSVKPAAVFGLPGGTIADGAVADLTVIDPEETWTCDAVALRSRSHNTPFSGKTLHGRVALTVVGGTIAYSGERLT
jgi:dihydroorotase